MVLLLPIGNEVYGYSQQPHDYLHNIEALIWELVCATMGFEMDWDDPLTIVYGWGYEIVGFRWNRILKQEGKDPLVLCKRDVCLQ
ncbi:hypothetical protein Tco_0787919 [Tanacetum coccineum]